MNEVTLPVIPLMITGSLCLVFTFIVFFVREQSRRFSNAERESLLPLGGETPRVAGRAAPAPAELAPLHDHAAEPCGCRSGLRAPCSGCLKHSAPETR